MGCYIDVGRAYQLLINSKRLGGHGEEKHMTINNKLLMLRLYNGEGARNGKVQWISSFLNVSDAAKALVDTLKTWPSDRYNAIINNRTKEDDHLAETEAPFKARFAFGSGVRTIQTNRTKVVVRPTPEGLRFMIVTFYPRPPHEFDV